MKTETLSIDLLRLDGDTQARIEVSADTVEEYAELITASQGKWPFGPLTVYHDGSSYFLADGFHRTLAARKAGRASVPCDVKKGTARDARLFGMKANDEHGVRMSFADRRSNVMWMLENYPDMTQSSIAKNAGVSLRTVTLAVGESKQQNAHGAHSASKTMEKAAGEASKTASGDAQESKYNPDDWPDGPPPGLEDMPVVDAAAAKEKAKAAAAAAKDKAKADAKAARVQAKADAKAAEMASLPADEQARLNRQLLKSLIEKSIRAVDTLHDVKPNRAKQGAMLKLLSEAWKLIW